MTERQAHDMARRLSLKGGERFVIYSPEDDDGAGPYQVATSFDLDTYFLGNNDPLACYIAGQQEG